MIEFESVGKTFRGTAAVVDLSLSVPSNRVTAIVGPAGCGGTTTLQLVNRMLEPTSGTITWEGTALRSRRRTAVRRQMGYVTQDGGLFPHRTVVDNIGTVPGLLGWSRARTRTRSLELLDVVGLEAGLADRYPAQLTGDQRQRVGLARALAADPPVLLMDDPFAAVDPLRRGELHRFFLDLQRELGKTVLMVTHEVDEAFRLGDQVAVLGVGGRLAQVGTPQQLLEEPSDPFVEGFIGRDRGYRSLSYLPASDLELDSVAVVREAGAAGGEPTLVVDADARPTGWVDPARPGELLPLGATFDIETGDVRSALDAALTSPFGLAVGVSAGGSRYAGVVTAATILAALPAVRGARTTAAAETAEDPNVAQDADAHRGYADHAYAELGDESGEDIDSSALVSADAH